MKLELVPVPVADVDRAKAFYVDQVGFHADHAARVRMFHRHRQRHHADGAGLTEGLQVVVDDVEAVREALVRRGVETSAVDVQPWGSFIYFSDPDGNTWAVQQIPDRA